MFIHKRWPANRAVKLTRKARNAIIEPIRRERSSSSNIFAVVYNPPPYPESLRSYFPLLSKLFLLTNLIFRMSYMQYTVFSHTECGRHMVEHLLLPQDMQLVNWCVQPPPSIIRLLYKCTRPFAGGLVHVVFVAVSNPHSHDMSRETTTTKKI